MLQFRLWLASAAVSGLVASGCNAVSEPGVLFVESPGSSPTTTAASGGSSPGASLGKAAGALSLCGPKAVAFEPPEIGEVPVLVGDACGLMGITQDANADGIADTAVEYVRELGMVTVRHITAGKVSSMTRYLLDAAGRLTGMQYLDSQGKMNYGEVRAFDAEGHLTLYETISLGGSGNKTVYVYRVTQDWEHGRLVRRVDTRSPSEKTQDQSWTYDAQGRLVTAIHRTGAQATTVAEAAWVYDSVGRPARVDRRVKGKPSITETWTWRDDGTLEARSAEVHLGVGGTPGRLDSYDSPTGSNGAGACYGCGYSANAGPAWADAMPAATEECQPIPTAIGHGYPEADYALDVQWKDPTATADEATYSPYAYGYYGYGGGGTAWYGHAGVGSNWDALAVYVPHTSARFDLTYDAKGRMVTERLAVEPTDAASTAPRTLIRERRFADDALVDDTVRHADAPGTVLRTLRFMRDASGRLLERELRIGETTAEIERWTLDALGRGVAHARFAQAEPWDTLAPAVQAPTSTLKEPTSSTQRSRRLDAAGRVLEERVTPPAQGEAGDVPDMLRSQWFDAAGRLVVRLVENGPKSSSVEAWDYDAAGRETLHRVHNTSHPDSGWFESRAYDAAGRLVKRGQGQVPELGPSWIETSSYVCEGM